MTLFFLHSSCQFRAEQPAHRTTRPQCCFSSYLIHFSYSVSDCISSTDSDSVISDSSVWSPTPSQSYIQFSVSALPQIITRIQFIMLSQLLLTLSCSQPSRVLLRRGALSREQFGRRHMLPAPALEPEVLCAYCAHALYCARL